MKKIILLISLLVIFSLFYNFITKTKTEDEFRVRIIPNSNAEKDLIVKKLVKDIVEEELNKELISINSNEEMEFYLSEKAIYFNKELKKIDSTIEVTFESHNFEAKTYNDSVLEANAFKTLLITIGEGSGDNFFSVIKLKEEAYFSDEKLEKKSLLYELIEGMFN